MRINKFIAQSTGISRRSADDAITNDRVLVNGQPPETGQQINTTDTVTLDNHPINLNNPIKTIIMNKPVGYICSRNGQGNKIIYDLLPEELHHLKPVGRLDKNSSGLMILTNDGALAHELTHPKFSKTKIYKIALNQPLQSLHHQMICNQGVTLEDGVSKLQLERINNSDNNNWKVSMSEGRNRQIRRTFDALGYNVVKLHRTHFGSYLLDNLELGTYKEHK